MEPLQGPKGHEWQSGIKRQVKREPKIEKLEIQATKINDVVRWHAGMFWHVPMGPLPQAKVISSPKPNAIAESKALLPSEQKIATEAKKQARVHSTPIDPERKKIYENREEMRELMDWIRHDPSQEVVKTKGLFRESPDINQYRKLLKEGMLQNKDTLMKAPHLIAKRIKELFNESAPFPNSSLGQIFSPDTDNLSDIRKTIHSLSSEDRQFLFDVLDFIAYVNREQQHLGKTAAMPLSSLTNLFISHFVPMDPKKPDMHDWRQTGEKWADRLAFIAENSNAIFQEATQPNQTAQKKKSSNLSEAVKKLPPPGKPHVWKPAKK